MSYFTYDTFFLPLITCWCQLVDLNFLWPLLRLPAMLILVQKENNQDEDHIFQGIPEELFNRSVGNNVLL